MRIGITEQGDAGLDLSWYNKLIMQKYDGAILITKNANDKFIEFVLSLRTFFPNLILHIGCTGLGGTWIEPNVPDYQTQLNQLQKLLDKGFPEDHIVLRMDPIIPTTEGLQAADTVLKTFHNMHTDIKRIRISILDEYRHVKERLKAIGKPPFYPGFSPTIDMMADTAILLSHYPKFQFETCAEPAFVHSTRLPNVKEQGCISETDLKIFGLTPDPNMPTNMQNRNGCHCLACKSELLNQKYRCPHQCIYCYWRDQPAPPKGDTKYVSHSR